jgi:hypothetical protein
LCLTSIIHGCYKITCKKYEGAKYLVARRDKYVAYKLFGVAVFSRAVLNLRVLMVYSFSYVSRCDID